MLRRLSLSLCIVALAGGGLSGCGGETRRALGLDKRSPDEFAVVSRAPLTVPPDFRLRPPEQGAPRPQELSTSDQARDAVFGGRVQARRVATTRGEGALLKLAGVDQSIPGIRSIVDRETSVFAREEKTFTDRLVFWRDPEPTGTMVDAAAEAKRLRQNQALGKAVTEGDTPKIERRQRALLEGLL
ncbi:DUF3035 domain-containing protein [Haematospirillum jordaniae]|uniref:Uncharacterized protein n=1 Tax=Haematospirillum jordaniae TaxID=1549855 RepID=A0A143DEZ7_9PROT|nr:DUF3035 domain-containing protein [Haematospirillum jordaniae]AMW34698.1 hypothetical protein AY555_05345 [Haematospirillum jordaniae]NKD56951.1 DUF3035 domain-containing protein [Haematospirillum jordaniae]NKD58893.1 DUF3035 domain-containing protein [Haematospirillum jordaniae]NKD66876.1 DUF3035 domain-containing protein [Haematospirillum jordaniae]NKD78895.1 DUF3035 domain-containing protein [Haematospirillum jordaniae]